MYVADLRIFFSTLLTLINSNPTVIIFTFSVVELRSYQVVLKMWSSRRSFEQHRFDFSSFPIILVGSDSELRENEACLRSLEATDDTPFSFYFKKFLDDTYEFPIETEILEEDFGPSAIWNETKANEQHTSAKMGKLLARRINAVKYM